MNERVLVIDTSHRRLYRCDGSPAVHFMGNAMVSFVMADEYHTMINLQYPPYVITRDTGGSLWIFGAETVILEGHEIVWSLIPQVAEVA